MADILSPTQFVQLLVHQEPIYDELILRDVRPNEDAWVGHYVTGTWPSHEGVEKRLDRFNHVFPNTTKAWTQKTLGNCLGTPCDKTEHCLAWGSTRITYFKEEISWVTPMICIDQANDVTHSAEQFEQIIVDILRPGTLAITGMFLRKRALDHSDHRYYISAAGLLVEWTFAWTTVGTDEYVFDCSVPPTCGKLVPQALQRQFSPLMKRGYNGKNPFKDTAPFIEVVTSVETAWDLDKLGGVQGVGGTPSIAGNWRFTEFNESSAYWRYGFAGQLGNFLVRTDWANLRFRYLGDLGAGAAPNQYRYELLIPFTNDVAGGAGGGEGLKSDSNDAFDNANFEITQITHKKSMMLLTADMSSLNPEMPFMIRDLGGKWFFATDGFVGPDGEAVEYKRHNKGQFVADFELAIKPMYTEFQVAYFHKREPMCIPYVDVCAVDSGYPLQLRESCPPGCE